MEFKIIIKTEDYLIKTSKSKTPTLTLPKEWQEQELLIISLENNYEYTLNKNTHTFTIEKPSIVLQKKPITNRYQAVLKLPKKAKNKQMLICKKNQ